MNTELILIAYNRPEHTKKVLEGIKLEGFKSISIYLDIPNSEDIISYEQHKKVLNIINNIDWIDKKITIWKKNKGLAKSITDAVTDTLNKKDAVIVLEDDCVPMKNFKLYVETTLKRYEKINEIKSINAYSYPITKILKNKYDVLFSNRFCPWGWATWKKEWEDFTFDLHKQIDLITNSKKDLALIGYDIRNYCSNPKFLNLEMEIWSLNWILAHFIKSQKVVYPKYSMINNIGFDGTGVHSAVTSAFNPKTNKKFGNNGFVFPNSGSESKIDYSIENDIIKYLEKVSKMTMIKNANLK